MRRKQRPVSRDICRLECVCLEMNSCIENK
jgi:hypothetical protein